MGKTSKTESTQKNDPPDWAKPGLEKGANEAMRLYDQGSGFNPYTGPTQAAYSGTSLNGMNALLAATGMLNGTNASGAGANPGVANQLTQQNTATVSSGTNDQIAQALAAKQASDQAKQVAQPAAAAAGGGGYGPVEKITGTNFNRRWDPSRQIWQVQDRKGVWNDNNKSAIKAGAVYNTSGGKR